MSLFSNDMRVANTATPSFASEANVGQFGWTNADAANYNQLIQYVDECRKIWLNLEEKILYVESILANVANIDSQVKYIEIMTNEVSKWNTEVRAIRDQLFNLYDEVKPLYADFDSKYTDFVPKYVEVVKMHSETEQAAIAAAQSELAAAASAKEAADVAEELRKGQVYRGTWNIESHASYPPKPDTNSVWDIVLNEGSLEYRFDNTLWYWGDRLLYLKDDDAYTQIEAGGSVTSVNGKKGAVTIDAHDVGAIARNGDVAIGRFEYREPQGTKGWPNATNSDPNNYINRAITAINPGNNGLAIFGDDGENRRRIGIQSGHATASYASHPGVLELNPFGGEVRVNGSRVLTTTYLPSPNQIGAVAKSGDTVTGGLTLADGNSANLTVNNNYIKGSNNAIIMRDHGNGNVTLSGGVNSSGAAGNLFLGYTAAATGTAGYNTAQVRLEAPMTWKSSHTLVDSFGKINVDHVNNAVKKTGDEMTGALSVFQNNITKAKILAGTTSGIMMTDDKDVNKWFSYYEASTNEYRLAEYVNGTYAGPRFQIGAGGNATFTGSHSTTITMNSTNPAGSNLKGKENGTDDWYVGRANAVGDAAFYSYKHSTGIILRSDHIEFTKNPRYGTNQIYHAGSKQPNLPNAGEFTSNYGYHQSGLSQFYTGGGTPSGMVPGGSVGVGIHMLRNTTAGTSSSDQAVTLYTPNTGENVMFLKNNFGGSAWQNSNGWSTIMSTKPLYGKDLNTLTDSAWHGEWFQDTTANATTARNYPIQEAGRLTVSGGPYGAMQEYTSYSSARKFTRGKSGSGNVWLPWREISSWGQLQNATLTAGHSNYGSGYGPAQYQRNGNLVILSGMIKRDASGYAAYVFQLPGGYRPPYRKIFACQTTGGSIRVDVATDGNVTIDGSGAVGWLSFDGITFRTEQ